MKNHPLLYELPYQRDSGQLFSVIVKEPWAVFLDSGLSDSGSLGYDILAARPYVMLETRGEFTRIRTRSGESTSREDPLSLVRKYLVPMVVEQEFDCWPFTGGAIGYFGYDLGRRIENLPAVATDDLGLPQMVIGIYDWVVVVDHERQRTCLISHGRDQETRGILDELIQRFSSPLKNDEKLFLGTTSSIRSNLTEQEYADRFFRIKHYIREGDCYQVNLAQRFETEYRGDGWALYKYLRTVNPAPYSNYFRYPFGEILGMSPERFLRYDARQKAVETKPIKGTVPRSEDVNVDSENRRHLQKDEKERAENLMIVDLLRNDIGKVCVPGSITVENLFAIESFAHVHHLVSTVKGLLRNSEDALSLLRAAFPGGSITGAPKLRAMEIIDSLEPHRRGVYCGSLGYIGYNGNMDSSIVIRTLVYTSGHLYYSAGGGIVADSVCAKEYRETYHKARVLFDLITGARS